MSDTDTDNELVETNDLDGLLKLLDAVDVNCVVKIRWTRAKGDLAARGWSSKVTMTVESSDARSGIDIERYINDTAPVAAAHLRKLRARAEAAEAELAALKGQSA